jgi:rubrerythrin
MKMKVKGMESMVKMEEDHAISLSASVEGLKNAVVREILRSIAHDSQKHAGLFTAISSLLKGESQVITEGDYDHLEAVMGKHIEVENRMMKEVKQLLETEKDSRVNHLLVEIYEDETRHHALMKRLLEAVIKRETIFDEDIWNMIWKDVPGHGAPIG